jgi:glycosyltransferase involved in cell wall biosynthesis
MLKISQDRWDYIPNDRKFEHGGKKFICIESEGRRFEEIEICKTEVAPAYGMLTVENPWAGSNNLKPWDFQVTAIIPTINSPETIHYCIDLLRLQTLRPYIVIIDTGSREDNLLEVEKLRDQDTEVHSLRLNGVRHPSDFPAIAMELGFSLCRSEFLFATHADCYLRKRNFVEYLLELCKSKSPAVGYELSPRNHQDWKGMLSHTASMYHMPTMDKIGFGWSLRRLCNRFNIVDYKPDPLRPNWPDTEILGNYILKENNIIPHLIGGENNGVRTLDDNIDHFRSYAAAKMYSPSHFEKAKEWFLAAKRDAIERLVIWRAEAEQEPPKKSLIP